MKNTTTISRKLIAGMMAVMTSFSVLAVTASADSSEEFALRDISTVSAAAQEDNIFDEITGKQAGTVFKFDGTRYTRVTTAELNKQIKSQYFDKTGMMRFVDNIREEGGGKKSIAEYLKENGQKLPEESYIGYAPHVDHRYILVDTKINVTKKYKGCDLVTRGGGQNTNEVTIYFYDMTETVKAIDIYDPECKVQDIVIRTYEREEEDYYKPRAKKIKDYTVAFLTISECPAAEKDNISTRKPVNENVQDTKGPKLDIKGPRLVFSDYKPVIKGPIVK